MGEVLLGATHLMFHVYVGRGGLQLCVENKIEEGLCIPLYLFISKFLVDPHHHNNLLCQPGCLRWEFFFHFVAIIWQMIYLLFSVRAIAPFPGWFLAGGLPNGR